MVISKSGGIVFGAEIREEGMAIEILCVLLAVCLWALYTCWFSWSPSLTCEIDTVRHLHMPNLTLEGWS